MENHQTQNFHSRLQELRERLVQEILSAEEALREDIRSTGDVSNLPTHPADHDATGVDEQLAIVANEEQLLEEVEAALQRIVAGTFGSCVDCQQPIEPARLDAIPHAPRCITCARRHEQEDAG